jgi:ATP-dependent protease HslVU (ClpYQ) peptidase subunit
MTCIIGYIDRKEKRIIMGADTAGVQRGLVIGREDSKIFFNRNFLIGFAYSFRMGQVLQHCFIPPRKKRHQDIYEYLCSNFMEKLRKTFIKNGCMENDENGSDSGCDLLIAYKDKLFSMGNDYQIGIPQDDWACIGCGRFFSLGALESLKDIKNISIIEKIEIALKASAKYSDGVRAPFKFLST